MTHSTITTTWIWSSPGKSHFEKNRFPPISFQNDLLNFRFLKKILTLLRNCFSIGSLMQLTYWFVEAHIDDFLIHENIYRILFSVYLFIVQWQTLRLSNVSGKSSPSGLSSALSACRLNGVDSLQSPYYDVEVSTSKGRLPRFLAEESSLTNRLLVVLELLRWTKIALSSSFRIFAKQVAWNNFQATKWHLVSSKSFRSEARSI